MQQDVQNCGPFEGSYQSLTRVSISKNLEKKWLNNFSLARETGIFSSFSCLDFQDVEKKILFLFLSYEIFQTVLILLSIFKIFNKTNSFFSRFMRCWDKVPFLFSNFQDFGGEISFFSPLMRFFFWQTHPNVHFQTIFSPQDQ